MIAAGSLVLKDVPAFTMMAGSPAKEIGKTDKHRMPAFEMKQEVTPRLRCPSTVTRPSST
jgi:serine acetyltransferase